MVVAFESASAPTVTAETPGGARGVAATAVPTHQGDVDTVYKATLPRDATAYVIDGRRFVLHPMPTDRLRVAFLADMGRSDEAWALWTQVETAKPDLVVLGGDIRYANGRADKWDEWLQHVEPLRRASPP